MIFSGDDFACQYTADMDAIVCDISALVYHATPPILREASLDEAPLAHAMCVSALSRARFSALPEVRAVREHLLGPLKAVPTPIHLLSPGIVHGSTDFVQWHSHSNELVPDDLMRIADGVSVLTPAAALRHLAHGLSTVPLTQILFELCGLYGICPETQRSKAALDVLQASGALPRSAGRWSAYYGADGRPLSFPDAASSSTIWELCLREDGSRSDLWRRPPLLKSEELWRLCETLGEDRASKRLRRALEFAQPGSGSPWETITAMLLSLPRKMGGEGLPCPQLNRRVLVSDARGSGARGFVLDGCWDVRTRWPQGIVPAKALARAREFGLSILPCTLEVDGAAFHRGRTAFTRDSERRTALAHAGIATQPVSPAQVNNVVLWDEWVDVLASELGFERVPPTSAFLRQRARLRKTLLSRDIL